MLSIVCEDIREDWKKNKPAYLRAAGTALGLGGGALLLRSIAHDHQEDFHTKTADQHEDMGKTYRKSGLGKLASISGKEEKFHREEAERSSAAKKYFAAGAMGLAGGSIGSTLYADIKEKHQRDRKRSRR